MLREGQQGPQVALSETFRLGRRSSAAILALPCNIVPDGQLGWQELRGAELSLRSAASDQARPEASRRPGSRTTPEGNSSRQDTA